MNAESGDNFFSRWSKRKQDERAGKPLAEPQPVVQPVASADRQNSAVAMAPVDVPPQSATTDPAKLPTLEDAQSLTPESDFKPFMAQGVRPDVKNAAMKKLFADPHFNVMDRMDTYIDDYSLPDPLPESMLRKMASAKFLNLFEEKDDEKNSQSPSPLPVEARDEPNTPASEVVAQSPLTLNPPEKNDDTDLRLQPDHALEPKGTGRGTA